MRATTLSLHDIKGSTGEVALSGRDVFLGPNGSGKTTIQQAISLALLGYIPGIERKPSGALQLSSGDVLEVGLGFDSGFRFGRTYRRTRQRGKDGAPVVSDSQDVTVSPGQAEKNPTERDARVARECGRFVVALDLAEFVNATASQRRTFCSSLLPDGGEMDVDAARTYLVERLLTDALELNDPAGYEAMRGFITECLAEWREGLDAQAGLTAMRSWAAAQQSIWNKRERDAVGAIRELSDLRARQQETDRDLGADERRLKELNAELVSATEDLTRAQEQVKAAATRAASLEKLRGEIASLEAALLRSVDEAVAPEEARLAEIRSRIREVPVVDEREAELDEIAHRREAAVARRGAAADLLAECRADLSKSQKTMAQVKAGISTCVIDDRIGCPKNWAGVEQGLAPMVAEAEQDVEHATSALKAIDDEIAECEEARKRVMAEVRNARTAAKAIETANQKAVEEEAALRTASEEAQKARAAKEQRLAHLREQLRSAEEAPVDPILPTDLLQKRVDGLGANITTVEEQIAVKRKQRDTLVAMQAAMGDATSAESKAACVRSLVDAVGPNGLQGEVLKRGIGAIAADVTEVLRLMNVDREAVFVCESARGAEVFDFGWFGPDGPRIFSALSTGERALYSTALVAAFLKRANPPFRCICLDNVENLDPANFARLLDGLDALIEAGRIDNVILSGVIDRRVMKAFPRWDVHELGVPAADAV